MPPPRTRKAEWEYSTNKHTVRARIRKASLSDYQRQLEQAKASDGKAVNRAWKIRADTNTFKMSSAEDQKMILEKVEKEVMERRKHKGIDCDTKVERFIQRVSGQGGDSSNASPAPTATMASPSPAAVMASQSPAATLASTTAVDSADEAVMDVGHNAGTSFNSLLNYESSFTRHDEYGTPELGSGMFRSPSFQTDNNNSDNRLLSLSQPIRGYGDFDSLPVSSSAPIQRDAVPSLFANFNANAGFQTGPNSNRDQVLQLTNRVDALTRDLTQTKSHVTTLEARLEKMETRLSEADDADDNRRIALHLSNIAGVFIEVAHKLDRSEPAAKDRNSG